MMMIKEEEEEGGTTKSFIFKFLVNSRVCLRFKPNNFFKGLICKQTPNTHQTKSFNVNLTKLKWIINLII